LGLWIGDRVGAEYPSHFAVGNLLITVLIRNELVLHVLFYIVVHTSKRIQRPKVKRFINRLLHANGDLHISSAFWSVIWFWIVIATQVIEAGAGAPIAFSLLLVVLLMIIVATAHPEIRRKNHDLFERVHRYVGWTSLGIFLIFLFLNRHYKNGDDNFWKIIYDPNLIMFEIILIFIIYPWTTVRKLRRGKEFEIEVQTNGIVKLTLPGDPLSGSFVRVSLNGNEWHAFAAAVRDRENHKFNVIIAPVGDWTISLRDRCVSGEPPSHLLLRKQFGVGFMRSIHGYTRVLCVCTGGGVAPVLSNLNSPKEDRVHILWVAKNFRATYGDYLVDVMTASKNNKLFDTEEMGRPDMAELVKSEFKNDGKFEAVFVVSNEKLTAMLVHELSAENIPAYGALWDS